MKYGLLMTALVASVYAGTTHAQANEHSDHVMQKAQASLVTGDNQDVGQATFHQTPNGVLVKVDLKNLKPGQYALHIHQTGDCSPFSKDSTAEKGTFSNAGGHLNPNNAEHGFYVENGPHPGDMPNITIPESGMYKAEVYNPMVRLTAAENANEAVMLDTDGAAVMIHEGSDDYHSHATGDAGGRMACGVIQLSE